jgi:hypothetical protein
MLNDLQSADASLVDAEAAVFGSEFEVFANSQPKELSPGLKAIVAVGKKQVTVDRELLSAYPPLVAEISRLESVQTTVSEYAAALKVAEGSRIEDQIAEWRSKLEQAQGEFLSALEKAVRASVEPRITACENLADLVAEMDRAIGTLQAPSDPIIGKLQAELARLEREIID